MGVNIKEEFTLRSQRYKEHKGCSSARPTAVLRSPPNLRFDEPKAAKRLPSVYVQYDLLHYCENILKNELNKYQYILYHFIFY